MKLSEITLRKTKYIRISLIFSLEIVFLENKKAAGHGL